MRRTRWRTRCALIAITGVLGSSLTVGAQAATPDPVTRTNIQAAADDRPGQSENPLEWAHIQAVGWGGTPENNLRYAQALDYNYVFHLHQGGDKLVDGVAFQDYERDSLTALKHGLSFYVNDPHKTIQPRVPADTAEAETLAALRSRWPYEFGWYPEIPRIFYYDRWNEIKVEYPAVHDAYKAVWEQHFSWNNTGAEFPYNLNQQSYSKSDKSALLLPEFQSQQEIDFWAQTIVNHIKDESEVNAVNYRFAGFIYDKIELWESYNNAKNTVIPVNDSGVPHSDLILDYANLHEGWYNFLLALMRAADDAFTDRSIRLITEPGVSADEGAGDPAYSIYDAWILPLEQSTTLSAAEQAEVVGDLMVAESLELNYLTDDRLYNVGEPPWFTRQNVGSAAPNTYGYFHPDNDVNYLNYLGRIATAGSWFFWYGVTERGCGGSCSIAGDPDDKELFQFPMESKLARIISGWDNLTAATDRSWDEINKVYHSSNSHADRDVIYTRSPKDGQLYVTFLSGDGVLELMPDETVTTVRKVNEFWEEQRANGRGDLTIEDGRVTINWDSAYELRSYVITTLQP